MVVPHLPPSPRLSPRNLCLSRGRWLDEEEEGGRPRSTDRLALQLRGRVGGGGTILLGLCPPSRPPFNPRPVRPPADYRLAAQSTPAACVSGLCALKSAKI